MASGAPDWERVFTLVPPSMTHGAPDWERTAVGPGGAPVSGITPLGNAPGAGGPLAVLPVTTVIAAFFATNAGPGYAVVSYWVPVQWSVSVALSSGFVIVGSVDGTSYSTDTGIPDYTDTSITGQTFAQTVKFTGLVYLAHAHAQVQVSGWVNPGCSATVTDGGSVMLAAWQ